METLYIRRTISQMCELNMDLWINDLGSMGLENLNSYLKTYMNPKLIKDFSVKSKPYMYFKKITESFYNLKVGKDFLIMTQNLETLKL